MVRTRSYSPELEFDAFDLAVSNSFTFFEEARHFSAERHRPLNHERGRSAFLEQESSSSLPTIEIDGRLSLSAPDPYISDSFQQSLPEIHHSPDQKQVHCAVGGNVFQPSMSNMNDGSRPSLSVPYPMTYDDESVELTEPIHPLEFSPQRAVRLKNPNWIASDIQIPFCGNQQTSKCAEASQSCAVKQDLSEDYVSCLEKKFTESHTVDKNPFEPVPYSIEAKAEDGHRFASGVDESSVFSSEVGDKNVKS